MAIECGGRRPPAVPLQKWHSDRARVGAYETALDRLGEAAMHVNVLVPGHSAVAGGPKVGTRLAADRAHIDPLRRAEDPVDPRLGPDTESLSGPRRA
jgi:hypothetical protein